MARRYRMSARAAGVDSTRAKIVEAAVRVHGRQGIATSSWEDIAQEAGVALATVYRHFPSPDALLPECARTVFQGARLPTLRQASEEFAGLETPKERLEKLVRESCRCYEQAEEWLNVAYREAHLLPALAEEIGILRDSLDTLVRAALRGSGAHSGRVQAVGALVDFPFWKSLIDRGIAPAAACGAVTRLAAGYLQTEEEESSLG
jgi:AcrR family transcriptional regulator